MNPIENLAAELEQIAEAYSAKIPGKLAKHVKRAYHTNRFNLAVVGEFNRGKSSLINTLLSQSLLPCDILPTTAVTYFVEYSEEPFCEIFWNTGLSEKTAIDPNRLENFSAEGSEYAQEISHIVLGLRQDFLESGLVIIDTPGVNDLVQSRVDVTDNILPSCDGALFVLDANTPLTKSELEFLKSKVLTNSLKTLIFIANKMDKVEPDEADEVLEFIESKLEAELGIKPCVIPYSALGSKTGIAESSGSRQPYNEFLVQKIHDLKRTSEAQKSQLLVAKLETACKMLTEELRSREGALKMSAEAFERAQINAQAQLQSYDLKFAYFLKNIKTVGRDTVLKFLEIGLTKELESMQWDLLDTMRSGTDLEKVIHRTIPIHVERRMRSFANEKGLEMQSYMKQFSRHITKEYEIHFGLQVTINGLLDHLEMPAYHTEARKHNDSGQFLEYALPSGVGALLGTLILPGVGTIIGSTAALYFAKTQKDKENEQYLERAEEIAKEICNNIYKAYMPLLADVIEAYFARLATVLTEYHEEQLGKIKVIYGAASPSEGHVGSESLEDRLEALLRDIDKVETLHNALAQKGGLQHV